MVELAPDGTEELTTGLRLESGRGALVSSVEVLEKSFGVRRNRTADKLGVNEPLYQLSYNPLIYILSKNF